MHISELDTPAVLIDLDIAERNLRRVADYASAHKLRLRPHTKTHKIPAIGRRQIELGAAGLTVAKTTEAEVMLEANPQELLIAYPVVGPKKLERLASLAGKTDISVSVDSVEAARGISEAASAHGVTVGILAEFDAGLHRVGVAGAEALLQLVRHIATMPGLEFRGIAFYPGHIKDLNTGIGAELGELDAAVTSATELLELNGYQVRVVSGGSTPTLFQSHCVRRLNEIRPGTYIFNDRNTWLSGACSQDDCAVSVLTTVVSTAVRGQVIIDGGSKTFSSDRCVVADVAGFGYFPEAPQAILTKMNEEHGFVSVAETDRNWRVGERVRVMPNHVCVVMNLHPEVYGIRGERVEQIWTVKGRGKLQ